MVCVADFKKAKTDVIQAKSSESLMLERKPKVAPIEEVRAAWLRSCCYFIYV